MALFLLIWTVVGFLFFGNKKIEISMVGIFLFFVWILGIGIGFLLTLYSLFF